MGRLNRGRALFHAALLSIVNLSGSASAEPERAERANEAGEEGRAEAAGRSDLLFKQGSRAFEAGRYPEALTKLKAAHREYPSFRTAAVLGQVELHLESYRDAAEHLDFALRRLPNTSETATRERVMAGLEEARRHVHSLSVQCSVRGASVVVDDVELASTPVGYDLFIDPGTRTVVVRKPGFEDLKTVVFMPAGGHQRIAAELEPRHVDLSDVGPEQRPAEPGESPISDSARDITASRWAVPVLVVGGALALGGAAAGTTFLMSSNEADAAAQDLRDGNSQLTSPSACRGPEAVNSCSRLETLTQRTADQANYATIAFVAGASAGVIGLAVSWLLWEDSKGHDQRVLLHPTGIALQGVF